MEKIKKVFIKHKEIIMYLIFGVATTLVRWATQWIFIKMFDDIMPKQEVNIWFLHYDTTAVFIATLLSLLTAIIFAFVTNKLWVFESKSWKPSIALRELWQFFFARFLSALIELGGIYLLVGLGVDRLVVPIETMDATILMSGVVMVLNYIFSKLIVFKNREESPEE